MANHLAVRGLAGLKPGPQLHRRPQWILFAALGEIANEGTSRGSVSGDSLLLGLGFLFVLGFGFWRGVGGAYSFLPLLDAGVNEVGFVLDVFLTVQQELGEIGEIFCPASGNAARGDELKELAEDVIYVGGGAELAGDGFEFLADFFLGEELLFFAGMD